MVWAETDDERQRRYHWQLLRQWCIICCGLWALAEVLHLADTLDADIQVDRRVAVPSNPGGPSQGRQRTADNAIERGIRVRLSYLELRHRGSGRSKDASATDIPPVVLHTAANATGRISLRFRHLPVISTHRNLLTPFPFPAPSRLTPTLAASYKIAAQQLAQCPHPVSHPIQEMRATFPTPRGPRQAVRSLRLYYRIL